jgi:hypothetical protein
MMPLQYEQQRSMMSRLYLLTPPGRANRKGNKGDQQRSSTYFLLQYMDGRHQPKMC